MIRLPTDKIVRDLPDLHPPVSVIIPYDPGIKMNPIHLGPKDEAVFVIYGKSIGHKRIAGAKRAKHDWLVQIDADGHYPRDYLVQVKMAINNYGKRFPLMMATRIGGIPVARLLESGMIVKRDYFLEKTKDYPDCPFLFWRGFWTDVVACFHGEPYMVVDAFYHHPLTKDERRTLRLLSLGFNIARLTGVI